MRPKPSGSHINLSAQIAQESQLLAEEKWIIAALTKIKKHRNCLQIERLHLENLKAQLKCDERKKQRHDVETRSTTPVSQTSSTLNLMQVSQPVVEFEVPVVEKCNTEELNLAVTNSVFSNTLYNDDMEEDEDELDNCLLDMNMLMMGQQGEDKASAQT